MSTNTILASAPLTATGYHLKATGTTLGQSLIWDNGTNVGIGNTNTSYTLDVSGTGRFTSSLIGAGSTWSGAMTINTSTSGLILNRGTTSQYTGVSLNTGGGGNQFWLLGMRENLTSNNFVVYNATTGNDQMTFSTGGNVGIGTSSPTSKLSVSGDILATGSVFNATTGSYFIADAVANTSYPTYGFSNNTGVGMYRAATDVLAFTTSAVERMRITSGGDVGIGNTGQSGQRLRITGESNTSSNYALVVVNSVQTDMLYVRNDGAFYTGNGSNSPRNSTTGNASNVFIDNTDSGRLYRSTSSIKYKKDVINYTKGLNEVMQLRPIFYKGISDNDGDKQFAGLIAEEVDELGLTEFVQYAEDGTPDALAYQNMVALAFKAIQELSKQNEELSNRLIKLESK